jgi:Poly(R)-hydroxyalkanoic acid synthase subunit (PHA_synth_III_E)
MADATATNPLFEMWRKQFEESAAAWARMVSQPQTPPQAMDPTAFWRPVLNQGVEQWARLFAQTPVSPDLAAQWKQFIDQWIEAWSKALGHVMNTEAYAGMMGRYLDQWLVAAAPMKKAAEQQIDQALATLNVASRSQLTAVAKQLVELEERLERMEDTLGAILRRLDDKERK